MMRRLILSYTCCLISCLPLMAQPWEQQTIVENDDYSLSVTSSGSDLLIQCYHQEETPPDPWGSHDEEWPVYVNGQKVSEENQNRVIVWVDYNGEILESHHFEASGPYPFTSGSHDDKVLFYPGMHRVLSYDGYSDSSLAALYDLPYVSRLIWSDENGNYVRHKDIMSYGQIDYCLSEVIDDDLFIIMNCSQVLLYPEAGLPEPLSGSFLLRFDRNDGHLKSLKRIMSEAGGNAGFSGFYGSFIENKFVAIGNLHKGFDQSIFQPYLGADSTGAFICVLDTALNIEWLKQLRPTGSAFSSHSIRLDAKSLDSIYVMISCDPSDLIEELRFGGTTDPSKDQSILCLFNRNGDIQWGTSFICDEGGLTYYKQGLAAGGGGSAFVTLNHSKRVTLETGQTALAEGGALIRFSGGKLMGIREISYSEGDQSGFGPVAPHGDYCFVVHGESRLRYISRIAADFMGTESIAHSSGGTLRVYPVPTNGVFNVQMPFTVGVPLHYQVLISDMSGRTVYSAPIEHGVANATIDISTLETGIYNLLLTGGEEPFRGRVLKD